MLKAANCPRCDAPMPFIGGSWLCQCDGGRTKYYRVGGALVRDVDLQATIDHNSESASGVWEAFSDMCGFYHPTEYGLYCTSNMVDQHGESRPLCEFKSCPLVKRGER